MTITLAVQDHNGSFLASTNGRELACLTYEKPYQPGDCIIVEIDQSGAFLELSLDQSIQPATLLLQQGMFRFPIPSSAARSAYPARAFTGDRHCLSARKSHPAHIRSCRNLAFNPFDLSGEANTFPHAHASTETKGEPAFAARNVIDGNMANSGHGAWPFTSWGINRDPHAELTIEFGRAVLIQQIILTLRADFPHDSWWQQATVTTSDGSADCLRLSKTDQPQLFDIPDRPTHWLHLGQLIKSKDPSPYPALTQIEIWGVEATLDPQAAE